MSLVVVASGGTWAIAASQGPQVVTAMERGDRYATRAPTPTTTPASTSTTAPATSSSTTSTTAPEPPPCDAPVEPAEGDPVDDWATLVVDPGRHLPDGFVPPRLQEVSRGDHGELQVRDLVTSDLVAMLDAAEAAGSPLTLVSGYRTYDYQDELYREAVGEEGEEAAARTTARPGHSEHQLGTAVDVLAPGMTELTPAFADTPAGRWVAGNAHRFGFVVSYPRDSLDVSCYTFEPWHLRYVGRDRARRITQSDLTPREWMLTRSGSSTGGDGSDGSGGGSSGRAPDGSG